jgi:hypothetical protein
MTTVKVVSMPNDVATQAVGQWAIPGTGESQADATMRRSLYRSAIATSLAYSALTNPNTLGSNFISDTSSFAGLASIGFSLFTDANLVSAAGDSLYRTWNRTASASDSGAILYDFNSHNMFVLSGSFAKAFCSQGDFPWVSTTRVSYIQYIESHSPVITNPFRAAAVTQAFRPVSGPLSAIRKRGPAGKPEKSDDGPPPANDPTQGSVAAWSSFGTAAGLWGKAILEGLETIENPVMGGIWWETVGDAWDATGQWFDDWWNNYSPFILPDHIDIPYDPQDYPWTPFIASDDSGGGVSNGGGGSFHLDDDKEQQV